MDEKKEPEAGGNKKRDISAHDAKTVVGADRKRMRKRPQAQNSSESKTEIMLYPNLQNFKNSCYRHSVLQMLARCRKLSELLLSSENEVLKTTGELFNNLSTKQSSSTSAIENCDRWWKLLGSKLPEFNKGKQSDVTEFLATFLFGYVAENLGSIPDGNKWFERLMMVDDNTHISCVGKDHSLIYKREWMTTAKSGGITLSNMITAEDLLAGIRSNFTQKIDVELKCRICHSDQTQLWHTFSNWPQYLFFFINRSADFERVSHKQFKIPTEIYKSELEKIKEPPEEKKSETLRTGWKYELVGCVVRRSSYNTQKGHYVTYARDIDKHWWLFDDLEDSCKSLGTDFEKIRSEIQKGGLILNYEKQEGDSEPMDDKTPKVCKTCTYSNDAQSIRCFVCESLLERFNLSDNNRALVTKRCRRCLRPRLLHTRY